MKWEEIEQFDETNVEHVQALHECCLEGGRVATACTSGSEDKP